MRNFFSKRSTGQRGEVVPWYKLDVQADSHEYIEMCLTQKFPERVETRNFKRMEGMRPLMIALQESGDDGVRREAKRLLSSPEYANFDVVYGWLDFASPGDFEAAVNSLREGLNKCPRKSRILYMLGCRMLHLDLAAEALYYWAQALHSQESSDNAPSGSPYLYLGYAAAALGSSPPVVAQFFHRADSIEIRGIRLAPDEATEVAKVFHGHGSPAMARIVATLAKKYL